MERERNEVYERIPWETLEAKGGDRQWWMFALAGAIVLGALAYSFMANRPAAVPVSVAAPAATQAAPVETVAPAPVPEVSTPMVVTEADLYAVAPERLIDRAAAHAEWFAAEYVGLDGSEEGRQTLAALLPAGVPVPPPPESTRVFVEWVRTLGVEEIAPQVYRVEVLVRSLIAHGEEPYKRQAPLSATVEVRVTDQGPQVVLPPTVAPAPPPPQAQMTLTPVPPEVGEAASSAVAATEVLGGVQAADGAWSVVVIAPGPDGVARPQTVLIPATPS